MSAIESDPGGPTYVEAKPRIFRQLTQPAISHDAAEHNPYSPVMCVAMLLIIGLIVKIGPAIHAYLVQN